MTLKLEIPYSLAGNQNKHLHLFDSLNHPALLHKKDLWSLVIKLSATVVSLNTFFNHMKKINKKSSVTKNQCRSFIQLNFIIIKNLIYYS